MNPRLRYSDKATMLPSELTSFSDRGGQFRSRRGAPLVGVGDPMETARRDAAWGATFGGNSVYGEREPAIGGAYGTTTNPIRISPIEQEALGAQRTASATTAKPFMPTVPQADSPDAYHQQVIDTALAYHKENGLPVPELPQANPFISATASADNDRILKKYGGRNVNTSYVPRLAALSL